MADWTKLAVAREGTHHEYGEEPAYGRRFHEVLKFHEPGLAAALDESGAFHIHPTGEPAYQQRFRRTFGFYEGRASVDAGAYWTHVLPDGTSLSSYHYDWCGNFQGGRCTVRDREGRYYHVGLDGNPAYGERHRYAGDYRDGIAVVERTDGLHIHINREGRQVHDHAFIDLDVFHKRFARARDQFGWTHVDLQGEPVYERRFAAVEPFYNGQARVERFDGGLEIIDERGITKIELKPTPHSEPMEGKVLARTAWGRVQLVKPTGEPAFVSKWTRGSNDREVEALLTLRGHPGVPTLLGRERFDMNDRLRLRFCSGEVVGQPRKLRMYAEREAVRVLREILAVCVAMHDAGWVHTDIHPGNVLTGEPATLLDFACAVRATYGNPWRGEINWGVWEYVPPEQLADFGELGPATDVYSSAALCVAMLRGAPPFRIEVQRHFDSGGWPAVRAAFLAARSAQGLDDIRGALGQALAAALSVDPAMRPTARQLEQVLANA